MKKILGGIYEYEVDEDGDIVLYTGGCSKIFLTDDNLKELLDEIESEESHKE